MKASMSSPTAVLTAASAAIIIPGSCVYALNEGCRSTTSTQSLSCLGVRCRPTYEGGCDGGEYTDSSTQTSCTDPDVEQVGTATICYYDDICCPIPGWSGEQQGDPTAAGSSYGVGMPIEDVGGYDEGTNDKWEGANGNNEWEEAWKGEYQNDYPDLQLGTSSSEHDGGNNGRAAGVAFAFVIIAVAAIYMFTMSKHNKRNERSSVPLDNSSSSSNDEETAGGAIVIKKNSRKKKKKEEKRKTQREPAKQRKTIYDIDSDSD